MLKKFQKIGTDRIRKYYQDKNRVRHDLRYLFWECTLSCNFYCKHCGSNAGEGKISSDLSTSEIKKTLYEIAEDFDVKKIMLAVTGGEPLLRNDIFEVMKYASSLGFPWGMVTNGFLVTREVVEKMKDTGMRTVVVSVDGIGKEHDEFRNKDGAYEKAMNAIKLLAEADFLDNLQITTTVHPGNMESLDEMYEKFSASRIHSWRLVTADPIGRAEFDKNLSLNSEQLRRLLLFIKEKRKKAKIAVFFGCTGFLGEEFEGVVRGNHFYCNTGINVASILHDGSIFVCPNVPHIKELIQGNVKKDRFSKVWENGFKFFREKNRTACEECFACKHWEKCLGNSLHTWDFQNKKPKICHVKLINEK